MASRRCTVCNVDWPMLYIYEKCPACLEHTWPDARGTSITRREAQSLKAHADFDRYYEAREKAKNDAAEALIEEALG